MKSIRNLKENIEDKMYNLMRIQKRIAKKCYIGRELSVIDTDEIINSLYVINITNNKKIRKYLKKGKIPKGIKLGSFKTTLKIEYTYIIELMLRLNTDIYGVQDILDSYKVFISTIESAKHPGKAGSTIENVSLLIDSERLQTISKIK